MLDIGAHTLIEALKRQRPDYKFEASEGYTSMTLSKESGWGGRGRRPVQIYLWPQRQR